MRSKITCVLVGLILGSGSLLAQQTVDESSPARTIDDKAVEQQVIAQLGDPLPTGAGIGPLLSPQCSTNGYRSWASSDYLLWWVKGAPLPIALVSTGSPADAIPGAIGQPGTRVLLGNEDQRFGAFSGIRLTLGGWLDSDQSVGIEGSGFLLERRSNRFFAASDAAGNPVLAFPFFNRIPGVEGEDALVISDPVGQFAGNVLVVSSLHLWGAEANGIISLWRRPNSNCVFLFGFRYADLDERLRIVNVTNDILVNPNTVTVLRDQFNTRNQFYGGQLGLRYDWQGDRLSLALTGKLALGTTHEVVDVNGASTQSGPFAATPGSFAGGLFTQPSNIGEFSRNQFGVIPSIELKVGYQLSSRCKFLVGYDFLYWNQVARPGNQIDRNINLNQSPLLGTGAALTAPVVPAYLFQRSDFWAQGVSFGLELRF
jgi:hypothetical protein